MDPPSCWGVGIPLPVLDEQVIQSLCRHGSRIGWHQWWTSQFPDGVRPTFGLVNYAQLKSGRIKIDNQVVRVAPLASIHLARQVALELKRWIEEGQFTLTDPVAEIARDRTFRPQDLWESQIALE